MVAPLFLLVLLPTLLSPFSKSEIKATFFEEHQWIHVIRSAEERLLDGGETAVIVFVSDSGLTEVNQLDFIILADKDVVRFDIPVLENHVDFFEIVIDTLESRDDLGE